MVLGRPLAHIPSRFTDDGHGRGDIDAVDPSQVGTRHAKQRFAQVELRLIGPLFLEPSLPPLFRQRGTLAAILSVLQILRQLAIAVGYLLLAKLVAILL